MHTLINYTDLPLAEKEAKAIDDIRDWFGQEKFDELETKFKNDGKISFPLFEMIVAIGGVEGYPVKVWYKRLFDE